ncbi:MAG: SWIM zinc finger family protein [Candidatus Aenigmarchaeota archaeon]|nr:SWIM zinc finger family protein [Candidatus Aenigmarchaeota archaeon]
MEKYQMERRVMRGAIIAQKSRLKKALDGWHVPSQTRHIYYRVVFEGFRSEPKCTCPDYEFFKEKCKHIYAVEFTLRREVDKDGNLTVTKSIRLSYPQNWPAYDKAQANEKENFMNLLGDLCGYIPEPEQASGRPMLSMRDMTFASALKVYSTFSLRRFMTYLREAKEDGHIGKAPSFASVGHFMQRKDVTPVLMELVEKSSLPLRSVETQFAMDSSGFSTSRFGRWYDFRHGSDKTKRVWFKAHVMVGVKTNVVTSLVMSDGYGNDGKHFPELMEVGRQGLPVAEEPEAGGGTRRRAVHTLQEEQQRGWLQAEDMEEAIPLLPVQARGVFPALPQTKQRGNDIPHDKEQVRWQPAKQNGNSAIERGSVEDTLP